MSINIGQKARVNFSIPQTELLAGTSIEIIAPVNGFVAGVGVTVQTAVTTGGTVQAVAGADGATNVDGAVVTVANGAAKGTRYAAEATPDHATRPVTRGQRVQVKPTGFATAGALNGYVEFATGK